MVALSSNYWGQDITVTGLLTGQDLLEGLQRRDLGEGILLPSVMLKQGDNLFLDDMTLEDLSAQLQTNIWPVAGHWTPIWPVTGKFKVANCQNPKPNTTKNWPLAKNAQF